MALIKEPQRLHFPLHIIGICQSIYPSIYQSCPHYTTALKPVNAFSPPYVKLDAHESDFNTEFICNATSALFAQQTLEGPWGALSHFYMQMALHLGSGAGMLGTHLCKSDLTNSHIHMHSPAAFLVKGTQCSCWDGDV